MVVRAAAVPVWVPWPLPDDWLVTGFAYAGDERTGGVACAVALSGPAPLGGPADMLVISEEPGVGLGAAYAGLTAADPGEGFGSCAPPVKVYIHGHPSPLWSVPTGPDRAAFAGEAMASWLWLVLWPETASLALEVDQMHLRDLRDHDQQLDLPYGAMSPRLTEPA